MTVLLLALGLAQAAPTDLELAYQREFAYLQAEKEALTERNAALQAEESRRTQQAESQLSSLQGRLLKLQSGRAELEERLDGAQRDADGASEAIEAAISVVV